jgi:hypothetical protein
MSLRRLVSALSVVVGVVASATVVVAQPKAPADPAAPAAPDAGSAVQMADEPPPADMDGVNENPDAPKTLGGGDSASVTVTAPAKLTGGYPIEEAARPITLPQNMSEVSLDPHIQVSPAMASTALRARYGITRQVQLGVTYLFGGLYDDPETPMEKTAFHPGKAVGIDVTVLVQKWMGVKVGVPVYVDPGAVGVTLGAPMRFRFGERLTIGGMDDLVHVAVEKFAPSLYQEGFNALAAATSLNSNTIQSRGALHFSGYGIYQYLPKLAIIGRAAVHLEDFSPNRTDGGGGITTSIRGGFQYTPRKFLDLGLSLGFDDLAHGGTFSPAGFLAVRI